MEEKQEKNSAKEVEPKVKKKDSKIKKVVVGVACALVLATAIVVPTTLHFLNNTEYTIVLDYGMLEREDESLTFKKGSTLADIEVPTQEGFVFAGFYADEDFSKPLDPSTEITEGMTIYLKYEAVATEGLEYEEVMESEQVVGYSVSDYTGSENEVVIPSVYNGHPVIAIDEYAFVNGTEDELLPNETLTKVVIPNSVMSIGGCAFAYCTGLTSIEIPNSVTSIGIGAFIYCSGLTSIIVDENNEVYTSRDGSGQEMNCIIEKSTNTLISGCSTTQIPDSVTSIDDYAFAGSDLTSIKIPNSVTNIGDYVFENCNSLTDVTIDSVYAYTNLSATVSSCGYLGQYATTIRVLKSVVDDPNNTNAYLNNTSNFTKADGEGEFADYYVYTRV